MTSGSAKALLFEGRADALRKLLLNHRQFRTAVERFETFDLSASQPHRAEYLLSSGDTDSIHSDDDGADPDGDDEGGDAHTRLLMIIGPSGAGKSSFLNWIGKRPELKSDLTGADGDIRPTIRINVPDLVSPKELVREICARIGAPYPKSWSRMEIARYLCKLFGDLKVRYLLMDEAHSFADKLTPRQVSMNARFLKFMLVRCRVPIILAGEEPLEDLLDEKALRRRTHAPIRLGPYSWGKRSHVEEWLALTTSFAEELGFEGSAITEDVHFLMRAYYDTGGIIGLLAERMIEAGRIALGEGSSQLKGPHFARAWIDWSDDTGGVCVDPHKILPDGKGTIVGNPYKATPKQFKALWRSRFAAVEQPDASRLTRRSSSAPKANRGFMK